MSMAFIFEEKEPDAPITARQLDDSFDLAEMQLPEGHGIGNDDGDDTSVSYSSIATEPDDKDSKDSKHQGQNQRKPNGWKTMPRNRRPSLVIQSTRLKRGLSGMADRSNPNELNAAKVAAEVAADVANIATDGLRSIFASGELNGHFSLSVLCKTLLHAKGSSDAVVYTQMMRSDPDRDVLRITKCPFVIFVPDGYIIRNWNLVAFCAIFSVAIVVPLEVAFEEGLLHRWANFVLYVFFCVDLALQFSIAYIQEDGQLEFEPDKIFWHYVCKRPWCLLADILAIVPLVSGAAWKSTKALPWFWWIFRISKVSKIALGAFHLPEILKLFLLMVLSSHWAACGWGSIEQEWRCIHVQWQYIEEDCEDSSLGGKYVDCLYHGLKCLLYGDSVDIVTRNEKIMFSATSVVGIFLTAMIIGLVTNLLSDMFSGFHRFQEEFSQYKHWTKSLKLEPHMRHKIESFFMNLWRRHNLLPSSSRDDQINTLNPAMQREVKVALYSDILAHLAILKGIDSLDHVIPDLANAVMSRYFLRNDAIIKIGTAADGLFIVDLGLAGVVASGDDTDGHAADETSIDLVYERGELFGEVSLIRQIRTGMPTLRQRNIIALTWSRIMFISAEDWMEIVKARPELWASVGRKAIEHNYGLPVCGPIASCGGSYGIYKVEGEKDAVAVLLPASRRAVTGSEESYTSASGEVFTGEVIDAPGGVCFFDWNGRKTGAKKKCICMVLPPHFQDEVSDLPPADIAGLAKRMNRLIVRLEHKLDGMEEKIDERLTKIESNLEITRDQKKRKGVVG